MKKNTILLIATTFIFFTGCKTSRTIFKPVKSMIVYPLPGRVPMRSVEFEMINVDGKTRFALDAHNYGSLSLNIADFHAYTQKLRVVIGKYEKDIEKD
jgi:hypothetical protein|tara:strand:+ start:937 stop:1230 length:294 start_codon:yes stop_codon:yes gene_type:complete